MLTLKAAGPGGTPRQRFAAWADPVSLPRRWTVGTCMVCAVFAAGVSLVSSNNIHRLWGLIAACAYMAAAIAIVAWRSRGLDLALGLAVTGSLLVPLGLNAATGRRQPEVTVISRSAAQLVHVHSPYQNVTSLAAVHDPNAYNPYLPVMSLFGVPRALFGENVVTDPRIWFGLAFVVCFGLALRLAGARHVIRWTVFVAATPVIAFELAVGGTDVPILALMALGLALLWRRPHWILAGLVLGVASAAKATAWPAVLVAAVLIGVRDGRKPTAMFAASALLSAAILVGPVAAVWPSALIENTIKFPLGLTKIKSAAASPLPGHLLAETGHTGHTIAVALLVAACVAVAVAVTVRPPRTVPAAAMWLIVSLILMFTLAPATRFGYYIYPGALLLWLEISRRDRPPGEAAEGGLQGSPACATAGSSS